MTKANIMRIIKESNPHKETKWDVLENKKGLIVITNDYDTSIRFEIQLNAGEEGNDIRVRDEGNLPATIVYLINGTEFYADFSEVDAGIEMAIKAIVEYFYKFY